MIGGEVSVLHVRKRMRYSLPAHSLISQIHYKTFLNGLSQAIEYGLKYTTCIWFGIRFVYGLCMVCGMAWIWCKYGLCMVYVWFTV